MTQYIQFTDEDGSTLLIETDQAEVYSEDGTVKAGLNEIAGKAITAAQMPFEQAVGYIIQRNAKVFLRAIRDLPQQDHPESLEVTFGLKATGEAGNAAIAKATGEANYTVKLTWKTEQRN